MAQINGLGNQFGMSGPLSMYKFQSLGSPSDVQGPSFSSLMMNSMREVANIENMAQNSISNNLAGGDMTLVESIISVREAELATRLMLQVQRKLVDAWKELKNMQI